jgi:hypothetical protein
MTTNCLLTMTTISGQCCAEVRVNSLHQLALLMPPSVVSYELIDKGLSAHPFVSDQELFDLLVGVVRDLSEA